MKRPLAYITAAWCGSDVENAKQAAQYCRSVYEAGFSPICPTLFYPLLLNDAIPEEHKSGIDMARMLPKHLWKRDLPIRPQHLLIAFSAHLLVGLCVDVRVRSEDVIADVLLNSLLQKQLADAISEHTENGFKRFAEDLRQEISSIFTLQIAAVEQDRPFNELALAVTSVLPVETFDRRFGVRHEPEREFDFLVCHANFPPILCATPLFYLKQRDYLRFRPQQGCFCPLNNPCPKVPNCPHCGQMCLPRCAHDTLAFSCLADCGFSLRRKPPAGDFLLCLPFP